MPDCKLAPYWWDHVPRPALADAALPAHGRRGGRRLGLHRAARRAADGARRPPHAGARRRGRRLGLQHAQRRADLDQHQARPIELLARRHGAAARVRHPEGRPALARAGSASSSPPRAIDCDFGVVGRFHAAHNAAQFEALAQRVAHQPKGLEVDAHVVPRAEQRSELGTDAYWGGVVYDAPCSRRPGALPPGPARARAGGRRAGRAAHCPVDAHRARRRRVSRDARRAARRTRATSSSRPTATPAR